MQGFSVIVETNLPPVPSVLLPHLCWRNGCIVSIQLTCNAASVLASVSLFSKPGANVMSCRSGGGTQCPFNKHTCLYHSSFRLKEFTPLFKPSGQVE